MAKSHEQISTGLKNDFLGVVKSTFGENLDSVIVYGSYLKPSYKPGVSDINVMILLDHADPDALRAFGKNSHRIIRRYRITPQVLTKHEFKSSADVFPMEYLDIVDTHKVLHGADVTAELRLTRENLRHELEHQLRGNLMSLRQLAIASGRPVFLAKRVMRREMEQWYGSLGALLRGVLRLYDADEIPNDPRAVAAQVSERTGLSAEPVIGLIECRNGSCDDSLTLMTNVVQWLTKLVEIIDAAGKKS